VLGGGGEVTGGAAVALRDLLDEHGIAVLERT
jgi:adenine/guanine phosphoribosyltransferase-like PRPP-binding protein